jgi:hypothetical protein
VENEAAVDLSAIDRVAARRIVIADTLSIARSTSSAKCVIGVQAASQTATEQSRELLKDYLTNSPADIRSHDINGTPDAAVRAIGWRERMHD